MDPDVAELAENIVNDLSKYNIVRFLYENPSFSGDVVALGRAIGLALSPRFHRAVDELVDAGIATLAVAEDGAPALAASSEGDRRDAVAKMLALPPESPDFVLLMMRLTARSLRQVVPDLRPDLLGGEL